MCCHILSQMSPRFILLPHSFTSVTLERLFMHDLAMEYTDCTTWLATKIAMQGNKFCSNVMACGQGSYWLDGGPTFIHQPIQHQPTNTYSHCYIVVTANTQPAKHTTSQTHNQPNRPKLIRLQIIIISQSANSLLCAKLQLLLQKLSTLMFVLSPTCSSIFVKSYNIVFERTCLIYNIYYMCSQSHMHMRHMCPGKFINFFRGAKNP